MSSVISFFFHVPAFKFSYFFHSSPSPAPFRTQEFGLKETTIWSLAILRCSQRTSLAVWWLRLHISSARSAGSIPGWGTKFLPK